MHLFKSIRITWRHPERSRISGGAKDLAHIGSGLTLLAVIALTIRQECQSIAVDRPTKRKLKK